MYERAGYAEIENFNANPVATFFGEKPLRGASRLSAGRGYGPLPAAGSAGQGPSSPPHRWGR